MTEFNPTKFKQTLHYIIEKVPHITLNQAKKLMYFIDFNYYELYEKSLTGDKYIKENDSNVISEHFFMQLDNLKYDDLVLMHYRRIYVNKIPKYTENLLFSLESPKLSALSAVEIKHIDNTIDRFGFMCYDQLVGIIKRDIPFIASKDNGLINYELVFYRSAEMSVRDYFEKKSNNNSKLKPLPFCHHEWKWNIIPCGIENPCDGDKKENCGKCPYYVGIKDYLNESEDLIEK